MTDRLDLTNAFAAVGIERRAQAAAGTDLVGPRAQVHPRRAAP
jgi:hypothetical protein